MNPTWIEKEVSRRFEKLSTKKVVIVTPKKRLQLLDIPGFQDLLQAGFYRYSPEVASSDRLRPTYPAICCVCGAPETVKKDVIYSERLFKKRKIEGLPFCSEHGSSKNPAIILIEEPINSEVTKVFCISRCERFLTRLLDYYDGDLPLPNEAFPELPVESSGWRQGEAEYWWQSEWLPYWNNLSFEEKQKKLQDSSLNDEWKEKIKFCEQQRSIE